MENKIILVTKIIDAFGGTVAVAKLCKITPPSVSLWKITGLPTARYLFFETLRPDLFTDYMDSNDPISDVLTDSTNTPTE